MKTDTPRTDEWETYCDECYYHMWRVRRKNERGFDDGFHVQNGEGARQLVELLNKQDEELTAARAEIEGLNFALKQASSIYDAVTEQRDKEREIYGKSYSAELARSNHYKQQRDRLAEALRNLVKANEIWNQGMMDVIGRPPNWNDSYLNEAKQALKSLTTKDHE
jgi:hypothetical protein